MYPSSVLSYLSIAVAAAFAREPPSICMLSPLATISAGQNITATVENPQGRPCEATLVFADPDFLPVTFDLQPMVCLGLQQAELLIPLEAPNGEVTVLWECAGDGVQSCSRASIEGGLEDVNNLTTQQTGIIECIVPTATLTTFSTSVQDTATIVNVVVETIFSTSTAALSTTSTDSSSTTSAISVESLTSSGNFASSSLAPAALAQNPASSSVNPTATSSTETGISTTSVTMTTMGAVTTQCSCSKGLEVLSIDSGSPFN